MKFGFELDLSDFASAVEASNEARVTADSRIASSAQVE
jgi:hypothetical protein